MVQRQGLPCGTAAAVADCIACVRSLFVEHSIARYGLVVQENKLRDETISSYRMSDVLKADEVKAVVLDKYICWKVCRCHPGACLP